VEYFQTALTGCYANAKYGTYLWTAGQRVDPSRESTFVWRVTTKDTYRETVSAMTYTNWLPGQPDYGGPESCMHLYSGRSYVWNDKECYSALCSVCELEL